MIRRQPDPVRHRSALALEELLTPVEPPEGIIPIVEGQKLQLVVARDVCVRVGRKLGFMVYMWWWHVEDSRWDR